MIHLREIWREERTILWRSLDPVQSLKNLSACYSSFKYLLIPIINDYNFCYFKNIFDSCYSFIYLFYSFLRRMWNKYLETYTLVIRHDQKWNFFHSAHIGKLVLLCPFELSHNFFCTIKCDLKWLMCVVPERRFKS